MPAIGPSPSRAARARALRAAAWCRRSSWPAAAATCRRTTSRPPQRSAAPRQIAQVDAEHLVDAEVAPHLGQLVRPSAAYGSCRAARKAALMPPAETPVRMSGTASGNSRARIPQHADLIRGRARRRRSGRAPGPADSVGIASDATRGDGIVAPTIVGQDSRPTAHDGLAARPSTRVSACCCGRPASPSPPS